MAAERPEAGAAPAPTSPTAGPSPETSPAAGRHHRPTAVIVGASVAGVRAAQALRSEGFTGRVVLVGGEPDLPYDKPPLSKQYLAGEFDLDRLSLLPPDAAEEAGIELRLGVPATDLAVPDRRVILADGTAIDYDACVIATGAAARPSPWSVPSGVHLLRTLADSDALHAALAGGGSVAVVGGGFIGAEVASTAAGLGCDVTVVDPLPVPMARVAGEEIGTLLAGVHGRHGVTTRFGVGVSAIDGAAGNLKLTLTDGTVLDADLAVVGIGAVPNDKWLASSGLLVENGVVCDQWCRAVDAGEVYAAGDVASWPHHRYAEAVRVEHWTNAVEQAACVAHNIAHPEAPRAYQPVEYVWSDQYDLKIQVVGHPERAAGEPRVVGSTAAGGERFAAAFGDGAGALEGAVVVNWPRALVEARKLARAGATLDAAVKRLHELAEAAAKPR